ncbi:MAG TPA: TlpA disulfide reductase family protein [Candidatus Limnocylindrales bacterium]|nr:TlpA disulfide reductase family protein [Candidatus Limnocylindrales bacterium]
MNNLSDRIQYCFLVLLAASLSLNVYLGWGLQRKAMPHFTVAQVGARLPELDVEDLRGKRTKLEWHSDGRPTLLYVFAPECKWCRRNSTNILALESARRDTYRFIGLSLSSAHLQEYVATMGIPFRVYANLNKDVAHRIGLGATPQTLLVSAAGVIEQSWAGAYGGKTGAEIEALFRVRLPGYTK